MKEVFAECGEGNYIELPLRANWGGHNVHFGSNIYVNSNLTLVDDGHIYVGDKVMFGPNVTIATANHPINAELRARGLQYNKDVHIGENAWIGAGVVIVPGVTIGKNTIIGCASHREFPDVTIEELGKTADKKMYEAKNKYYHEHDRRKNDNSGYR
jgi:galactoside O-acetyltransferase